MPLALCRICAREGHHEQHAEPVHARTGRVAAGARAPGSTCPAWSCWLAPLAGSTQARAREVPAHGVGHVVAVWCACAYPKHAAPPPRAPRAAGSPLARAAPVATSSPRRGRIGAGASLFSNPQRAIDWTMRPCVLLSLAMAVRAAGSRGPLNSGKIEHFVVLYMENRVRSCASAMQSVCQSVRYMCQCCVLTPRCLSCPPGVRPFLRMHGPARGR